MHAVVPPAGVAELELAFAGNMVASLSLFHHHTAPSAPPEKIVPFEGIDHILILTLIRYDAGSSVGGKGTVGAVSERAGVAL